MEELFALIKADYTVIVVVLYFLGRTLRRSCRFPNCYIPLCITIAGIVLAGLSSAARMGDYANVAALLFDTLAQGILCAGMSVYVHEFLKQTLKK